MELKQWIDTDSKWIGMDRNAMDKMTKKITIDFDFSGYSNLMRQPHDAHDSNAAIGTHSKGGREFASCQKLLHTVDARRSHSLRAFVARGGLYQFKKHVAKRKCEASTDLQKSS